MRQGDAIVIAMRVALHEHAAGKAKMIEQLDIGFDRRVGRGVAPARREGEFVCRTEDMRMRIPCLRRRFFARNPWTCYRAGYRRRLPHTTMWARKQRMSFGSVDGPTVLVQHALTYQLLSDPVR